MSVLIRKLGPFALLGILGACGGGGGSSSASTTGSPAGPVYATPLPYAAETPDLPGAPPVPEAWRDWLVANHHAIATLDMSAADDSDLSFLQQAIGGRSIVMLGESSHRVDEFDQAKGRVIRYLHEHMGFDVVVFESSLYECFRADEQMGTAPSSDTMHNSIFFTWDCAATGDLFDYLKQTQTTADPMILAGMDIQDSVYAGSIDRASQFKALIAPLDSAYADSVAAMDQEYLDHQASMDYNTFLGWVAANGARLEDGYTQLSAWLDTNRTALEAANPDRPLWPRLARQAAWSMSQEIAYLELPQGTYATTTLRDAGMAANLDFLLQLYPGKKVIVWAHNFHIEKASNQVVPNGYTGPMPQPFTNFGQRVQLAHGADTYVVGLYMLRGTTEFLDGTKVSIHLPLKDSLEATLYTARRRQGFVDLRSAPVETDTAWVEELIPSLYWGSTPERQVLRDQYDGVLWVDTVHPPVYQ